MAAVDLALEAAKLLETARRLVVFTGAGVSKESGVPTYEETLQGRWAEFDPIVLSSVEMFEEDPELVWGFYQDVLIKHGEVKPNAAHRAIVEMERLVEQVVVVTQNVDGLHGEAGSSDVIELHGSLRRYRCLPGRHQGMTFEELVGEQGRRIKRCPHCGEVCRPEIVCFGEMLPIDALGRAFTEASRCDAMLVVGTRAEVQPAAAVPFEAAHAGAKIIEVNVKPSAVTSMAHVTLETTAGDGVPRIARHLASLRDRAEGKSLQNRPAAG